MLMKGMARELIDPVGRIIDDVITTSEERENAKLRLAKLNLEPYLEQIRVNAAEAASPNLFVSGWRPFIGWVCGTVLVWNYIIAPMIHWIVLMVGAEVPVIPTLGINELMPVLMGLLGLGGLRTFEKYKGVEGNR